MERVVHLDGGEDMTAHFESGPLAGETQSMSNTTQPESMQPVHTSSQVECSDVCDDNEDTAVFRAHPVSDLHLELLEFHARHRLPYAVRFDLFAPHFGLGCVDHPCNVHYVSMRWFV